MLLQYCDWVARMSPMCRECPKEFGGAWFSLTYTICGKNCPEIIQIEPNNLTVWEMMQNWFLFTVFEQISGNSINVGGENEWETLEIDQQSAHLYNLAWKFQKRWRIRYKQEETWNLHQIWGDPINRWVFIEFPEFRSKFLAQSFIRSPEI